MSSDLAMISTNKPMPITEDQIRIVYQVLLGRDPDPVGLSTFLSHANISTVIDAVRQSDEAMIMRQRTASSPFYHFNSKIDVAAIVVSHQDPARKPVAGRLVNYLGVVIDPAFLPSLLDGRQGEVEGVPIPANWHADMAEFAAALRGVDLAEQSFRMVELGCGWGCWLLNTGVAARRKGLTLDLIGAEGDEGHVAFAKQACRENGFSETEARIYQRIVGPHQGVALFPVQAHAGEQWGLEAVFNPTPDQLRDAEASGRYQKLEIITFDDLVVDGDIIDLLHMDVQGVEADFIDSCIDAMDRLVAYVVVGTHSRSIEGRIFATMLAHGWELEIERPALFSLAGDVPQTTVDGVQGWRNLRLRPK